MKLDRHFGDFNLTTAFTWGKAMDFQSGDDGALLFYINIRRDYARADFDRSFNFNQSYVYSLPFGKGKKMLSGGPGAWILGNWQVSGILTLMSGMPVTVTASGTSLNTPGETQTANQVAPVQILKGINTGNLWFSTSSFAQPTGVVFGNTGRNIFSGPGLFAINASLFKNFRVGERANIELRGESFNLTNTPAFGQPQGSLTSSTFGYVTSTVGSGTGVNGTGGGRSIQMGLKVSF